MEREQPEFSNFDLFILALSVFSVLNLIWFVVPVSEAIRNTVTLVDVGISLLFLADFVVVLRRAPHKSAYFFKGYGWVDLISSLPFPALKIARIFRIVRVWRPMREMGPRGVWRRITVDLAGSALLVAVFLVIVVLEYGGVLMLWAEQGAPNANITSGGDAVWWGYVTITTVGYGDRFPVTNLGRVIGVVVMTVGVGLFGVITGFLANSFLSPRKASEAAAQQKTDDVAAILNELVEQVGILSERMDRFTGPS
jgi:voltage-gated potassium channel Kch